MTPTIEQQRALAGVVNAVIESVKAGGTDGAPGGILYAALMGHGCSLNQFESLMSALVGVGKLAQRGDCYFAL